ncbi:MAG: hypothetical protein ACLFVU_04755 [Phycisphaerae bacterium]
MKKSLTICLMLVSSMAVLVSARPARAVGISKEGLQRLARNLEKNAELMLAGKPIVASTEAGLKSVEYDEISLGYLKEVLAQERPDPINLYVAQRLITPLLNAKVKVMRMGLPVAQEYLDNKGEYQELPFYSKAELKRLQIPEELAAAGDAQAKKRIAEIQKRRREKLAEERAIALHNRFAYKLQITVVYLTVRADVQEQDDKLMTQLEEYEKNGNVVFKDMVEAIRSEAYRMPGRRAAEFYDYVGQIARKVHMRRDEYYHPAKVNLKPTANSTFQKVRVYPGIVLCNTINQLAVPARKPAYKVPDKKQIDKRYDRNKRNKRRRR